MLLAARGAGWLATNDGGSQCRSGVRYANLGRRTAIGTRCTRQLSRARARLKGWVRPSAQLRLAEAQLNKHALGVATGATGALPAGQRILSQLNGLGLLSLTTDFDMVPFSILVPQIHILIFSPLPSSLLPFYIHCSGHLSLLLRSSSLSLLHPSAGS